MAFRRRRGAPKGSPGEDAIEMVIPEAALPTDPCMAKFADGSIIPIACSTVAGFKAQHQANTVRKGGKKAGYKQGSATHFKEKHGGDGKEVTVYMRNDAPANKPKVRLCCLKHDGQPHVCTVNIILFAPDAAMTAEAQEAKAIQWMIDMANGYCAGTVDRDDIPAEKKKLVNKSKGIGMPEKRDDDVDEGEPKTKPKTKSEARAKAKAKQTIRQTGEAESNDEGRVGDAGDAVATHGGEEQGADTGGQVSVGQTRSDARGHVYSSGSSSIAPSGHGSQAPVTPKAKAKTASPPVQKSVIEAWSDSDH